MEMMSYGHVYVARVAFGARVNQVVQALVEADAYPGPSLVIAYSPCVAHGYDLRHGAVQQELVVDSGIWPLYRFDPRRVAAGKPPLVLDSGPPKVPVRDYMRNEARFRMVAKIDPKRYATMVKAAQRAATERFSLYQQLAKLTVPQRRETSDEEPV
jgi:pyruvate-ferredoxin/flavodoxin oxidoreductase